MNASQLELSQARFDGQTYESAYDQKRLTGQLQKVHSLMSDGQWRSLREIQEVVGGSEAGVSARLRDLRKPRFKSHVVERRRVADFQDGKHVYRMALCNCA